MIVLLAPPAQRTEFSIISFLYDMAKLNVEAGDIFLVPTKKGDQPGYLIGRTLSYNKAATIEIFDCFHDNLVVNRDEICNKTFKKEDRLFPPIMAVFLFDKYSGKEKWPLLGESKTFDKNNKKHDAIFLPPHYSDTGWYVHDREEKQDPENKRDRIAEDSTIWQPNQIVFRTRYYMDGIMQKGDVFNYSKVAGDLFKEGKLDQVMNEAISISNEVSLKIKRQMT